MIKINQSQRKKLHRIAKKYRLKLILAFGSQLKGQTHPMSDLDIAVWGEGDFNWHQYSELIFELEKVFPEKKIDLALINRADPLLLHKISQSFFCLYGAKRMIVEFRILAFKRYQDYQPFFRLEEKCVDAFVKQGV
jgi:predicted nucleotidyltransferase